MSNDTDCKTCSWPKRETVNLVCQTCGTDYAPADGTEEVRRQTFAEVAAGLNTIADIFQRSGEDRCRVRICRELANAHRAYAEGYGAPCGSSA